MNPIRAFVQWQNEEAAKVGAAERRFVRAVVAVLLAVLAYLAWRAS